MARVTRLRGSLWARLSAMLAFAAMAVAAAALAWSPAAAKAGDPPAPDKAKVAGTGDAHTDLPAPAPAKPTPPPVQLHGVIDEVSTGGTKLTFTADDAAAKSSVTVARRQDQLLLRDAHPGDTIDLTVDQKDAPTSATQIAGVSRLIGDWDRIIALGGAAVFFAFVVSLATWWKPQDLVIGLDKRVSNSQTQFVLWFGIVAIVYLAATGLRVVELGFGYIGGVNIGANLLALSGLSALSFGGAKIVAGQKQDSANQAAAVAAANNTATPPQKTENDGKASITDLFQNDSNASDLGDLQMILITISAATIFLLSAYHFLGALALAPSIKLPDIDTTVLGAFGIGQGAYLAKKAALPVGQG